MPKYKLLIPKNILLDLNVILDLVLGRPGREVAKKVLTLSTDPNYKLYVSSHCVTTFDYVLKESDVTIQQRHKLVEWLLKTCNIVAVNHTMLTAAIRSGVTDFEDAVVEQVALKVGCTVIITRNIRDFKHSVVPAITPDSYLE